MLFKYSKFTLITYFNKSICLWFGNVVPIGTILHHIAKSQINGFIEKKVIYMNLLFFNNKFFLLCKVFLYFEFLDPQHHLWAVLTLLNHSCSDKLPLTPHHIQLVISNLNFAKNKKINVRLKTWFLVLCWNGG